MNWSTVPVLFDVLTKKGMYMGWMNDTFQINCKNDYAHFNTFLHSRVWIWFYLGSGDQRNGVWEANLRQVDSLH